MSFTCFECHINDRATYEFFRQEAAVARDAQLEGRTADAKQIRERIVAYLNADTDYFVQNYPVGYNDAWPDAALVWAPRIGVSVGACESCSKQRPCVNT